MISRIITRGLLPAARLCLPATFATHVPRYTFGKIEKASKIRSIIEEEIKTESENLNDLSNYEKEFNKGGWTVNRENTLVELSKTVGAYQVRLLSNIKTPTQFDEEEGQQQEKKEDQEENFEGEMNEVTICVTKTGIEKTMCIHTIVTEGFEITNINFANNYQEAKAHRLDIFNSNHYTGPEIETLSEELFESIYGFIEEELGITNEVMESVADYCLDGEQSFYI